MAIRLPLQAVPNQSFSIQLDGLRYFVEIKAARGIMAATITIDDEVAMTGARFFADTPLIPHASLESGGGNFIMTTELDAIPDYTLFDVTQFLFYLTAADLADAR